MKRFPMRQLFGKHLADGNRGNQFRFRHVEPLLNNGHKVVFDFSGVENMTDSFANACFGVLAQNHPEEIGRQIRFEHATPLITDFIVAAISHGIASQPLGANSKARPRVAAA